MSAIRDYGVVHVFKKRPMWSRIYREWRRWPADSKFLGLAVLTAALTIFFRHTVPFIQYEVLNR